jgi:hypothetical protein
MGVGERLYILEGTHFSGFKGSQAVPARLSGRGTVDREGKALGTEEGKGVRKWISF